MVISTAPPRTLAETRIVFHSLPWQGYQQILQALPQGRAARLIYDRGTLEIAMPSELHEFTKELIGLFIRVLVVELGLNLKTLGSTTLDREDLDRGAEPDNAYYIQNQPLVAGRRVDLATDPPPDLVVEVDITHTDMDKLSLYAALGVPEFWRYNGETWHIYQLQSEAYQEVEHSPTFPQIPKELLCQFLAQAQQNEVAAEQTLRDWLRTKNQS